MSADGPARCYDLAARSAATYVFSDRMLSDRLKNYDNILLFGPTSAKDELNNKLRTDKHFAAKTLKVESAGQLTENQMIAKVKKFFNA